MTHKNQENHLAYAVIFLTSMIYAPLLSLWQRRDPIGFNNNTWLTVVVGCGYTLLYARLILPAWAWLRICKCFFFACIPIIARSLLLNSLRNYDLDRNSGGRRDE